MRLRRRKPDVWEEVGREVARDFGRDYDLNPTAWRNLSQFRIMAMCGHQAVIQLKRKYPLDPPITTSAGSGEPQ